MRPTPFARVFLVLIAAIGVVLLLRLGPLRSEDPVPPAASPPAAAAGSPSAAELAPPRCEQGDDPALLAGHRQWRLTLVDTARSLPAGYVPPSLVSTEVAGFAGPFVVRQVVIEDLEALRLAAEAAGNPVEIVAAYRSFEQQQALFDARVAEIGRAGALRKVARAGHSEHQLGTAVDFKTRGAEDVDLAWESTAAGRWMAENAHRFGFVMSYAEGAQARTCYAYEPWHFRYFGRDTAADIRQSGLTVREYLWREAARRDATP